MPNDRQKCKIIALVYHQLLSQRECRTVLLTLMVTLMVMLTRSLEASARHKSSRLHKSSLSATSTKL